MTYYVLFDLGLAGLLIAIAACAIFARAAFVSLVLFMGLRAAAGDRLGETFCR